MICVAENAKTLPMRWARDYYELGNRTRVLKHSFQVFLNFYKFLEYAEGSKSSQEFSRRYQTHYGRGISIWSLLKHVKNDVHFVFGIDKFKLYARDMSTGEVTFLRNAYHEEPTSPDYKTLVNCFFDSYEDSTIWLPSSELYYENTKAMCVCECDSSAIVMDSISANGRETSHNLFTIHSHFIEENVEHEEKEYSDPRPCYTTRISPHHEMPGKLLVGYKLKELNEEIFKELARTTSLMIRQEYVKTMNMYWQALEESGILFNDSKYVSINEENFFQSRFENMLEKRYSPLTVVLPTKKFSKNNAEKIEANELLDAVKKLLNTNPQYGLYKCRRYIANGSVSRIKGFKQ